eukprot:TRINITY_DN499_c0_g1_i1.p1 TRINITY_DN499_c0_g1~~TRINITY_DN499_c0_g1_i1.p1  ORF type:complete len:192 (-),score=21.26 TRINITY_DN499_c0_g1_i1:48-623(-)
MPNNTVEQAVPKIKKFYKSDPETNDFCGFCYRANVPKSLCGHSAEKCPRLAQTVCGACRNKGHTTKFCKAPLCTFCYNREIEPCYGHTSDDCPVLKEHVCERCNFKGHTRAYCDVPFCLWCKRYGHKAVQCKDEPFCNFCWNAGKRESECFHTSEDCEELKEIPCSKCMKKGHLPRNCKKNTQNRQKRSDS